MQHGASAHSYVSPAIGPPEKHHYPSTKVGWGGVYLSHSFEEYNLVLITPLNSGDRPIRNQMDGSFHEHFSVYLEVSLRLRLASIPQMWSDTLHKTTLISPQGSWGFCDLLPT